MNNKYVSPTDARILKSLQGSMGNDNVSKALGADANELLKGGKEGLTPKKVQVTRGGKTFEQTTYVRVGDTKVPAPDKKLVVDQGGKPTLEQARELARQIPDNEFTDKDKQYLYDHAIPVARKIAYFKKRIKSKSSNAKALDIEKDDITIVMPDHNHSMSDVRKFIKDNGKDIFPNGHQTVTVKDLDSEVGGTTTMYIPADVKDVDGFKKRFEKLMTEYLESGDEDKMQNFKIRDAED